MPRRPHGEIRRAGSKDRGAARVADSDHPGVLGGQQTYRTRDGDFLVRSVSGAAARKEYRCPGCRQQIAVGTPHVVAWPAEDLSWVASAVDARRHWHRGCWDRWSSRGGPLPG